ncbi:GspL/Epsl periplasmic domain-containing protein [Orrella marina]|nr:GspL/Epsl periplasmic domain-containing protein [Orrella marina]
MRQHFRIQLPALKSVNAASLVELVQVDPSQRVVHTHHLRLDMLADTVRSAHVYVLLDPADAVVAEISLPPLPRTRQREAVVASVEPMILGRLDTTLITYAPRDEQTGTTQVAWTDKDALLRVWRLLLELGLKVKGIMPGQPLPDQERGVFEAEDSLTGNGGAEIRPALPALSGCSFTLAHEEPLSRPGPTRSTMIWTAVAAGVWIVGLNLYAMQLNREAETILQAIESTVRAGFPEIPVLLDPVIQAQRQLDLLERKASGTSQDPFIELVADASVLLPFVSSRVRTLEYENGHLTLGLASGANMMTDSPSRSDLNKEANRLGLILNHDESNPDRWQVSRQNTTASQSVATGTRQQ